MCTTRTGAPSSRPRRRRAVAQSTTMLVDRAGKSFRPQRAAMLSNVRAVLFDAVGTVLYPNPPAATAYYEAGQRFGSRLSAAEVARRYAAAFRYQEALDRKAG